jgi:KTSC domain-containing protein
MLSREPVSSSLIAAIGYDEDCEMLEVEFASGALYRYHGIPAEVFDALYAARSKGKFFNEHIRDAYPWEQVE